MTTIIGMPNEIYTSWLLPQLSAGSVRNFGRASKAAQAIVEAAAKAPQNDIDLKGERVSIKLDGSIAAFLRQMKKMSIFARRPELVQIRIDARAPMKDLYKDPDDMQCIYLYAKFKNQNELLTAGILFDFNNKKPMEATGECGLGNVLVKATHEKNTDLAQAVLFHPNAAKIPAKGSDGLGKALVNALMAKNLEIARTIFSHPNAVNIPAEGNDGLGNALINAIPTMNAEVARAILSHSNAAKIPLEGKFSLQIALAGAKMFNCPEFAEAISNFIKTRS